jgi:hypothetical protein
MAETLLTFDAGFPGDTVADGTNGIDDVVEGTQTYEAGYHGATRVRAGDATNTASTRFRVELGLAGDHFGSVYLRNKTAHGSSSAVNFLYIVNSSNSHIVRFRVKTSNALSIVVNNIEVRAGTAFEIPVDSDFRFDWELSGTTMNWRVFYDPEAPAASTPDVSGTTTVMALTADALHLGANSSSAIFKDWSFDTVRAKNTGSWYEPYEPPTVDSGLTVWNGASEVATTVTVWDGSNEVAISGVEINP